jgi:hypothetical protein
MGADKQKLSKARIAFLARCKLFGVHLRYERGSTVTMANALLDEGFLEIASGRLVLSAKGNAALAGEKESQP